MTTPEASRSQLEEAGRLYVEEGWSVARIAAELGLSRRTLDKWRTRQGWVAKRRLLLRQESELEEMLERIKLRLARMALPEEEGGEVIEPQKIYALCRVVAVLRPAAGVELRRMDREEAEATSLTAEERMARVMELLRGAGFITDSPGNPTPSAS